MDKMEIGPFEAALRSLKDALAVTPRSELEGDGLLQRFEFTFELSWKMMLRVLTLLGRTDLGASPRPIMREPAKEGLISDLECWFTCLEAKNLLSHTYSKVVAEDAARVAEEFLPLAEQLAGELKKRV